METQENDVDELVERITQTVIRFSHANNISWTEVLLAMSSSMLLLTEDHCRKHNLRPDQVHELHVVSAKAMHAALVGTSN